MNAEALLAHYERIAEAPDAIARLRRFVLDLAVRGKLVPQEAGDEPASLLLQRVKQEWARLLKAGAVREPTNAVQVRREDSISEVPEHWRWARLIEIAKPAYGFAFSSAQFNSERRGMPLIRIRDMASTDTEAYFDGDFEPDYVVRTGDYLVGMDGDFNLRRWRGQAALLNQRVMRINGWRCGIASEYVRLPLQFALDYLHGHTSQTTVKHLSAKQVNGIEIPFPPLAEQHRIVAKVNELMALCDRLEAARTAREATRDRLAAASLARLNTPDPETFPTDARFALDALPALTTRPDQIKQLRQTILNLAVRGKLVAQIMSEEPASSLLKAIRSTRSLQLGQRIMRPEKKDLGAAKGLFASPAGWIWVLADSLWDLENGDRSSNYPSRDQLVESGAAFVNAGHLVNGRVSMQGMNFITRQKFASLAGGKLHRGDQIYCLRGSLGKHAVYEHDQEAAIASSLVILRPIMAECVPYLALYLDSDIAENMLRRFDNGSAQPNLSSANLRKYEVPLPPLAEQHRIVAKVNALMALCNALEASLAAATSTRTRLLEATLRDALHPNSPPLREAAA